MQSYRQQAISAGMLVHGLGLALRTINAGLGLVIKAWLREARPNTMPLFYHHTDQCCRV